MTRAARSNRAATRWTIRIIPLFIVALFVLGTYAVVYRLCVRYLYRARAQSGLAATFLALYSVFLVLAVATYLRTFVTIQRDPGLVPLLRPLDADAKAKAHGRDAEASPWVPPDQDPDSPGLEAFYSKDVFVCEADGRPKWCSDCRQWKPDRAHHSSELGRCVRKMDHLCPWVGGMVSETSFNFFFQFTFYTTCLCSVSVAAGAYCLQQQTAHEASVDGWVVTCIVLASLFGFFTFAMTLTAGRFTLTNITNIDMVKKAHFSFLAVRIPRNSPSSDAFPTIVYPLHRPVPVAQANGHPARDAGRDLRASRMFAILRTDFGENPWDLGLWANWNHEGMESDYQLGPLLAKLKKRYGVPELNGDVGGVVEMHDTGTPGA